MTDEDPPNQQAVESTSRDDSVIQQLSSTIGNHSPFGSPSYAGYNTPNRSPLKDLTHDNSEDDAYFSPRSFTSPTSPTSSDTFHDAGKFPQLLFSW